MEDDRVAAALAAPLLGGEANAPALAASLLGGEANAPALAAPVLGGEANAAPVLGGEADGNGVQPWWTKAWVKWTALSMLTVAIMVFIGRLSVGSLDYKVWTKTMAGMDGNAWKSALFAFAGDLTTLFLIYSPLDSFIEVLRVQDVGARSHVANVAAIVNCSVWTWYATVLPSVNFSVLVTNVTGAAFHTGYLIIFFRYCRGRRAFFFTWVAIGVVLGLVIAGVCLLLLKVAWGSDLPQVVGFSGLMTGIAMYLGGTADNMFVAHWTNGEEGMVPLWATLGNALLWTLYAKIIGDTSMLIPNAFGVGLCALQFIQRALYRFYMPSAELEARLRDAFNAARAKLAAARGEGTDVPAASGELTDAPAARTEETDTAAAADDNGGQP